MMRMILLLRYSRTGADRSWFASVVLTYMALCTLATRVRMTQWSCGGWSGAGCTWSSQSSITHTTWGTGALRLVISAPAWSSWITTWSTSTECWTAWIYTGWIITSSILGTHVMTQSDAVSWSTPCYSITWTQRLFTSCSQTSPLNPSLQRHTGLSSPVLLSLPGSQNALTPQGLGLQRSAGVNGLHDTKGSPVWVLGQEQIALYLVAKQSAPAPQGGRPVSTLLVQGSTHRPGVPWHCLSKSQSDNL